MSLSLHQRCICLVLLLLGICTANAADHPVRYLGIIQGLSNNAVTTIYQDKLGFMWFGTYDGLNRYDGYGFQVFRNKVGDTSSLIGNSVYTIAGDAKDNIWIGGQKGACVLDAQRKKFTWLTYTPTGQQTPVLLQDDIHTIVSIDSTMVLIGTNHLGLIVFNELTGTQVSNGYDVTAIEKDATGNIWVFVNQQGLFKYANGRLIVVNDQIRDGICLRSSTNGHLWLGSKNGLFEYNPHTNTYSGNRVPGNSNVVHIREDRQGSLWIGSDGGGLLVMNRSTRPRSPLIFWPWITAAPIRSAMHISWTAGIRTGIM